MKTPAFYADAPTITMKDALAQFLGAVTDGLLTYTYADAAKLAGHSCPTVAGAFLMTHQAVKHLYDQDIPVRGDIQVDLRDPLDAGVAGVVGNVISLITGAASDGGFKGIAGNFNRSGLLNYGVDQAQTVRFTRRDTGQSIGADYDPSTVAPDPRQGPLMQAILSGTASEEEKANLGVLWQKRVATIMTSPELWSRLVTLS